MTQLPEQAIERVQALPDSQQDAVASLILEKIIDEQRWDEAFAGSRDQLARPAAEVREQVAPVSRR